MPFIEEAINGNEKNAIIMLQGMTNNEYSKELLKEKIKNWYESSLAEARLGYLKMYSESDISNSVKGLKNSFLVISGKKDSPFYNIKILKNSFNSLYDNVNFIELDSTHYPMNEIPQILASEIEDFLI